MTLFVINLVLAVGWCALTESFSLANVALGVALGYGALWVARPIYGETAYFSRIKALATLLSFFLIEMARSSAQVAWDVLTPRLRARPGLVEVPLELEDDWAITLLALLVSLTPGTLALDVSGDRRTLLIHAMYAADAEAVRRSIKDGMERRVGAVFARSGR